MRFKIIWIFFHIIVWLQINTIDTASIAVCFLIRPASETLLFAEELALDGLHYDIDVFVMVDDNSYTIQSSQSSMLNGQQSLTRASHVILERELIQNKEHVMKFFKYPNVIKWLREVATNLTMMLTNQVQRELKQIKLQPKTKKLGVEIGTKLGMGTNI
ncbi:hypothetical protein I4U23_003466 [Adineta vaga]|nr:hypothetical protein I4U23_003466 [Adineta vaga]